MATPADLTGKALWLRGKDLVGPDGGAATAWADQSGKGHHVVRLTNITAIDGATPSGGRAARALTSSGAIELPYPLHPTTGLQALCSTQYNAGYRYDFLVDGVADSNQLGWASRTAPTAAAPQWAQLQLAAAKAVTTYRIYRQPNASLNRCPKDWTFEGSTDGATWTVLDTRAGVAWVSADTSKVYTFANPTAYPYYRIRCTATQGNDLLHLAEITLDEVANGDPASPGELWMVARSTAIANGQTNTRSWALGRGIGGDYYPYADGAVYDDFINAVRRSFTPTMPISEWRLLRVTLDAAGALTYRIDETVQATFSGVTAAWPLSPYLLLNAIGIDVAEALLLTQPASAAEVSSLITYFNTEHGLAVPGGSAAGTPQVLTGKHAALAVTAPVGDVTAGTKGPVALDGLPAMLTVEAPLGDVTTLAHGDPVALDGKPSTVNIYTPKGEFTVSTAKPVALDGTPATVQFAAPRGSVGARRIPLVVDTVRLTGVMGASVNVALTPEPGDVVVIVRSVIQDRTGTGEVSYKISGVTGLGATWTVQHKSEGGVDTSWAVGVVGSTPSGSATVTFDDPTPKPQMVVAYLIRGVDETHTTVASMSDTGDGWDANPGQIVIEGAFDQYGYYPAFYQVPGANSRPSAAAWTAVAPYRSSNVAANITNSAAVGYAIPRTYQDDHLNPKYQLGADASTDAGHPLQAITTFGMVVGTAITEPKPVTLDGKPVNLTVTAPAGTVQAEEVFGRAGLGFGSTLTVQPITFLTLPPMSAGAGVGSEAAEGDEVLVEVAEPMECGLGVASRLTLPRDWGEDPRTGRPTYRVRVVTRDGAGVTELDNVTIGPETDGVGLVDQWTFRVPRANKKAKRVLPIAHQAQLWRGNVMLTKGDIGPGRADGAWMAYDVRRPDWILRDRRLIGRIPRQQILRNPGFTQGGNGLAHWVGAYDSQSALKAPPQMRAVDDDYAIPGTRALEMGAVDKVVVKKVDVESPAVFVPNQATYLKGGEDKIKAVGEDIPEGSVVRITGFTANDGTGDGLQLSLKRAQAAKKTLAAMGKKFVFKLPTKLRSPNANDGTVAGRGYYEPVASNSTEKGRRKNRRVSIAYEGTQTATGHQQYVRQTLTVRNTGQVPATYTLAGDMRILRWDGAPKDGWAMRLMLLDIVATKETVETSAVFAPNSAAYLDGGEDKIKKIGEKIPEGAVINLVGHTADNRRNGDPGDGLDLSLARAKAARATLAGMDRKFTFKLPDLTKIPSRQRKDDGQVAGRGYYDPVASNATDAGQAKNRRVEIFYTAKTVVEEGAESSATMNELTPRVEWEHYETSVDVPNDGKSRTLEVRLYPPAGASRWTNVGLYPNEQLGFYRVDQALIVKALVEHAQDVSMGHGDLGIKTRTPLTGMPRTKEYAFQGTPLPVGTALDWFTSIYRGVDIDCEVTPDSATMVTHYPRQGTSAEVALVHGGKRSNVKAYKPLWTGRRELASSIIMQSDESGSFRPQAYARDAKALGGTLMEAVISAESETPPSELAEGAGVALAQSINPRPGWEVTIDPAHTTRMLDEIGKGDLVRVVLPDEGVDQALRMVQRTIDPATDTLTLTLVEV